MSDEKKGSESSKQAGSSGKSGKPAGAGGATDNGAGKAKAHNGGARAGSKSKKSGKPKNKQGARRSDKQPGSGPIAGSKAAPPEAAKSAPLADAETTPASTPAEPPETPVITETSAAASETAPSAAPAAPGKDTTAPSEQTSPAQATPLQAAPDAPEQQGLSFGNDEIRSLLVPVPPVKRLIAAILTIGCFAALIYINLQGPIVAPAGGVHTINIPEPGSYVVFFKGKTEDAFGWSLKGGRFRNSLQIDIQPMYAAQFIRKLPRFKDLSGSDFFSLAEYEVVDPGEYMLFATWKSEVDKCEGKILLEKDPVERFFIKWALGIVGTIAFFYMLGIPLTTRSAQSTLPPAK